MAVGAAVHPAAGLLALVDPGSDDEPGACAAALRTSSSKAPRQISRNEGASCDRMAAM